MTANTALIVSATAHANAAPVGSIERARAFAEPLISAEHLNTGENILHHADAIACILNLVGASEDMKAANYLVYASNYLNKPQEIIAKAFGDNLATLAVETTRLIHFQREAREKQVLKQARERQESLIVNGNKAPVSELQASQNENIRKMLLAFSRDLRVVMLRLASRLQTLRYFASVKRMPPRDLAAEALQVFAPLANRLGIWQIKWEMEDLAFRFLEPETYHGIARLLDEKRSERESYMTALRERLQTDLEKLGVQASVQGRPKHIYSIAKKMRGKSLDFSRVFDLRALRVVVPNISDCYAVLAWVHEAFQPVPSEFDDYIAQPKPNGYQSLHTVVRDHAGKPIEIQIRTEAMHEHAEHGVAAHWAYKEAGTKGYAGVSASSAYDAKIAVLRQLLAWEQDLGGQTEGLFDDRIYVLTPDAAIVELPKGATPLDFAYTLHTSLGHRCRGAKVNGNMVPLSTPLQNGQTVEIIAIKEGGPSRDWLNPELGYLVGSRAKAKVRAWFNNLASEATIARGREAVEKLLQREGKTAIGLDELAQQMGFESSPQFFEVVGKDELSLRSIESHLHPVDSSTANADHALVKKARSSAGGQVLVVGVDSMLTHLSKCCKPAPPDSIGGFVTKGKGVSIHRCDCPDYRHLMRSHPERVIPVQWHEGRLNQSAFFPVDVAIEARDRQGLLRDISEVFTKEKINVIGVQTQSVKGMAWMTFTAEITDAQRLQRVFHVLAEVDGVIRARRK